VDKAPLKACKYCLGVSGKKINSKQMSKEDLEAWLLEDHSDPASLLNKVQPKGVKNGRKKERTKAN
jgi:hypothetical protein